MEKAKVFTISTVGPKGRRLDEMAIDYKNGDDYVLAEAIELLQNEIKSVSRKAAERTKNMIDHRSFESAMLEGIWKAFETFDPDRGATFTTFLVRVVNNEINDVYAGREGTYADRFVLETDDGYGEDADDSVSMFDRLDSGYDVENEVIEKIMDDERSKLVDDLREKAPQTLQRIVDGYLHYHRLSDNKIANKLGLHHMQLKRNVRKLAGFYDVNRFGDINDYLIRLGS